MGAVKNLFVRIGGDASGVVNCFKSASSAGSSAKESIKKSSAETKKAIHNSFSSPIQSVNAYVATVNKTKVAHEAAKQNVSRLTDQIAQLEGVYGTIKNATDGLDLSKSLVQQISSTEEELDEINAKIHKTQTAISRLGNPRSASKSERLAALQDDLQSLIAGSENTAAHLRALDQAAGRVGSSNMGYASTSGLKALQSEITAAKNQLRTTQAVVDTTGQKLKSLRVGPTLARGLKSVGSSAMQAAKSGIAGLGRSLKNLAGSSIRKIASIPGKLRNIGRSASAGCGGLGKMARSIRNIGLVSLGMRVAAGMFGRLRSIVSEYISQNSELSASVTAMKNQFSAALAPAINLVLTAMQRLMPVVIAVSNGIGAVFTALFGKVTATGKAISSSADAASAAAESLDVYGFDQITKESDDSSGSGGGSAVAQQTAEQSALVQKLTNWIQQLKAAFVAGDWKGLGAIVGNGINNAVNAINTVDIGAKVGRFVNNLLTTLNSAIATIDFFNIGAKVGQMVTAVFQQIDWNQCKQLLTNGFMGVWETITGFASGLAPFQGIDFSAATESLQGLWQSLWNFADLVGGALAEVYNTVLKPILEWVIEDAVPASVDIFTTAFDALSAALKPVKEGLSGLMAGLEPVIAFVEDVAMIALDGLKEIFEKVSQVFTEKGGKVQEIVSGIGEVVAAVWKLIEPIIIALKARIGACFDFIGDIAGTTIGFVIDVLGGLIDFVAGVFTGDWGRAWDGIVGIFNGIVDAIKGTINSVIGFFNGMISGVCSGVNTIIRAMNKLSFDIPDWDIFGDLAGKKFGFNISTITAPQIPKLAKGTVVDKPTAAVIGEAGKEVVMPLENNTGWITQLAQQINQQGGGGPTSLALTIHLRGRKLTECVIQDINQITKENGVCPIHV